MYSPVATGRGGEASLVEEVLSDGVKPAIVGPNAQILGKLGCRKSPQVVTDPRYT